MSPSLCGRGTAALCVFLSLAGCARSTIESLRTDPGVTYQFQIDKKLEDAYQKTVDGFTRCLTGTSYSTAPLTSWSMAIRPRMAADHRSASIAYLQHAATEGYWATVDFTAVDPGTKVDVFAINNPGVKALGPEVERWISGAQTCGVGDWVSNHKPVVE